ncbi:MAG: DNA repair protein RadC [Candidatus Omnitrophica bacterium]|nr:DNA repair protein RadC [Candidatus Omnitrophota bacterium]
MSNSHKTSIKNWPKDDRPREKLFREGEHKLSNTELLAILLRSGVKGESAVSLARRILNKFGSFRNMSRTDLRDWKEFKGLGQAKIAQVKAAIEIGRRLGAEEVKEEKPKITSSKDVVRMLSFRLRDLKKEVFKVLLLDSRNRVIEIMEAEEGTVNQAYPIVREILKEALQRYAVSIICVHNHPSGDPAPSRQDKDFTTRLVKAAQTLDIRVLDHIIIGDNKYYSFADEGMI